MANWRKTRYFETPDRIEHVVFGDQLVPLTPEAIHALSLNAQLLAIGRSGRTAPTPSEAPPSA